LHAGQAKQEPPVWGEVDELDLFVAAQVAIELEPRVGAIEIIEAEVLGWQG